MTSKLLTVLLALSAMALPAEEIPKPAAIRTFPAPGGEITYSLDTTAAPDLAKWSEEELMPVVIEWYPKLCGLLASEGYQPPAAVKLVFRDDMKGTPAYATGSTISLNAPWFRGQMGGEAKGCVVHEMVHVVQGYKRPAPGWVVEGIADYVRWYLYEPQSKGAEIGRGNFSQASYDSSYRITANFLRWVIATHDKDFLAKLNRACREGRYSDEVWKEAAGKSAAELGADWKAANARRLGL